MLRSILFATLIGFAAQASAQVDLQTTLVAGGTQIVDIRHAGDGSGRLFLVNQRGRVSILDNGEVLDQPFIDIRDLISVNGQERGLLSMAFSPRYAKTGRFYLFYTDDEGSTIISSFRVSATDPDVADPDTRERVLRVIQPQSNHNGGRMEFGSDGYLYLGLGDGGGGGDPDDNGQDPTTLLGAVIRIDPESQESGYAIPPDNPFVNDPSTRDEIWALGVRNPWRSSFDPDTQDLFVADVGQSSFEEITIIPSGQGGMNLGWNQLEGNNCFVMSCTQPPNYLAPAFVYGRDGGACSVTGGETYRGQDYPALEGIYFFGDFCNGRIYGLTRGAGGPDATVLLDTNFEIVTFGKDELGNVYVSDSGSGVYLLSDGPVAKGGRPWDGTMSGTYVVDQLDSQGFFVNVGANDDGEFVFFAWFTFENGEPLWLTGVAGYDDGDSSVTFSNVQRLDGLEFLDFSDASANRETVGSMVLTAASCERIIADYDLPGMGNLEGTMDLDRLTNTAGHLCE